MTRILYPVSKNEFAQYYVRNKKKNPLPPEDVGMGSSKKVWWRCRDNRKHLFLKSPLARSTESQNNNGCPICLKKAGKRLAVEREKRAERVEIANKKRSDGSLSLLKMNPGLAKEYSSKNRVPVDEIRYDSKEKVLWVCKDNPEHVWEATPYNRHHNKSGCHICTGEAAKNLHSAFIISATSGYRGRS